MRTALVMLWVSLAAWALPTESIAAPCSSLTSITLPRMTITSATEVAAGAFTLPADAGVPPAQAQAFSTLPAFCRVTAVSRPSADSEIALEVWMPTANWNTRFQPVGNGL